MLKAWSPPPAVLALDQVCNRHLHTQCQTICQCSGGANLSGPISRDIAGLSLHYTISRATFFRENSSPPKWCLAHSLTKNTSVQYPIFATYRAIIVRDAQYKTSMKVGEDENNLKHFLARTSMTRRVLENLLQKIVLFFFASAKEFCDTITTSIARCENQTAKSTHHPHKIDVQHRECKTRVVRILPFF